MSTKYFIFITIGCLTYNVYAQKIIRIVRPYVLIDTDKNIGKIGETKFVYRDKVGERIEIGKIVIIKFKDNMTACKIELEYLNISIGDFVLTNSDTETNKSIKKIPFKNNYLDITAEYENPDIFGFKVHFKRNYRIFIGGKLTFHVPNGKKYEWSQSRAETFYDSDFQGYSKKQSYGLNAGIGSMVLSESFFIYCGLGFLYSTRYRQYYDNTFTDFSREYYIEDGKKTELIFDAIIGAYFRIDRVLLTFGYSSASEGYMFGLGYRFASPY